MAGRPWPVKWSDAPPPGDAGTHWRTRRDECGSRLAGYEDTHDAERLAEDPTFRMLASRERRETSVALTSTLHWFETDVLAEERNYDGLAGLNMELVRRAATRSSARRVILDIDSSESPGRGAYEP